MLINKIQYFRIIGPRATFSQSQKTEGRIAILLLIPEFVCICCLFIKPALLFCASIAILLTIPLELSVKKYVRGLLISKRRTKSQKRPNVFFSATHFITNAVEMYLTSRTKATSTTSITSMASHTSVETVPDLEHF